MTEFKLDLTKVGSKKKSSHQKIRTNKYSAIRPLIHDLNKVISEEHEERIINNAGTVQKFGDFKYQDGGTVPVGEPYHIHYSRIGKSEIYMTGTEYNETSLIIDRVKGNTNFGQYVELKQPSKGMDYLDKHKFKVTNKHRKIGRARRYFARQGNDLKSPVFEISKASFKKKTPFYKKKEMVWSLDINRQMMINDNIDEINRVVREGFKSLEFVLNPNEGYLGDGKKSQEEKLNKLSRFLNVIPPDDYSTPAPLSPGGGPPPSNGGQQGA